MERMSTQTTPLRKAYAAPRLKLYGSVLSLTAGGTGPADELYDPTPPYTPGSCNNGMNGSNMQRKHCY